MAFKKRIYLDYAAATPLAPQIARLLARLDVLGNPSSLHSEGRRTKLLLTQARTQIAKVLNARPEEIIFTASGTEANNLALQGMLTTGNKAHLLVSAIEHHSILSTARTLAQQKNIKLIEIDVSKDGSVSVDELAKQLTPETRLVSIGYANNEIGTVQNIKGIARTIRAYNKTHDARIYLHTDACQAPGLLPINVQELGVDLMTISSGKIYGPPGIAALFVRRGTLLQAILQGGSQERGLRPGTETVALAIGFAQALELAEKMRPKEVARLTKLRDYLIENLTQLSGVLLNGHPIDRLANNANISLPGVSGEMLVLALDRAGIAVSTGAACTARETGQSHVLKAIGSNPKNGNLRITLGRSTTKEELEVLVKLLQKID